MKVVVVPQLMDNYAYLVIDEATGKAAIVDCAEAEPVLAAVERESVDLVAIWPTHHHYDHVGGNDDLLKRRPGLEVIGYKGQGNRIPGCTREVDDGEIVRLGGLEARILFIPAHTTGHVAYHLPKEEAVFTGDTLFAGGCGRLFEGDPPMMLASLSKLMALPDATRVYFGHEYTAANLRFAAAVEPGNAAVARRIAALPTPSTPSTIADERATNPFLRAAEAAVIAAARARGAADDPVSVFAALREWKNDFR